MKYILPESLLAVLLCLTFFASCSEDDSYAERREKERKQIASFIEKGCSVADDEGIVTLSVDPINVISESVFQANDSLTDVDNNEYVLFNSSGVYMQIVRKGAGSKLEHGEGAVIIARFTEYNIAGDSIQATNNSLTYEISPDKMYVSNSYGVFSGTFSSGLMYTLYSSSSMPSGWLIPFTYINVGRQSSADEEVAKVRLIVPSTQGQSEAMSSVYPCFYEITFQKGR